MTREQAIESLLGLFNAYVKACVKEDANRELANQKWKDICAALGFDSGMYDILAPDNWDSLSDSEKADFVHAALSKRAQPVKYKVFLNGVNMYDGDSEPDSLACWALAIRIVGVTSANAHLVRHAGDAVAREEHYRFGMLKSEDLLSFSSVEKIDSKERVN